MIWLLPSNHTGRFWIITAFGIIFTLIVAGMCWLPHGVCLFESENQIRASILIMTPLGTSIEKVKTSIQTRMHPDTFYYYEHAPHLPGKGIAPGKINWSRWPLGGEHHGKAILCQLGQSGFFEDVCADWAFDDEGRLVDVFVFKHANLP